MSEALVLYKVGEDVEGYRIISEIGQGAASVVYLVQEPKNKQIYSMKHVHRGSAKDDRFLQQAIGEYQVASKLDHPSIRRAVKLFKRTKKFFQLTDVLLLMEYFDGRAMDSKPPKTFDEALQLFHQTAEGLAHMHGRGFVHADMKPNNILVAPGPDGPIAKIIDLGQSCAVGTVKERIQGTPDYIAPEQVHRRPITAKTDIYNLGATMYWTLTGQHIPTALGKGDALVSRIDDALMPKPTPAREINSRIPARLNELIMQCVEVDPVYRPESMAWVADKLNLVLAIMRGKDEPGGSGAPLGGKDGGKDNMSSAAGLIMNSGSGVGLNGGSTAMGIPTPEGARANMGSQSGTQVNSASRTGDIRMQSPR